MKLSPHDLLIGLVENDGEALEHLLDVADDASVELRREGSELRVTGSDAALAVAYLTVLSRLSDPARSAA